MGWGGWKVDTSENEPASGGGKNEKFYTYYQEGLGRRESTLRRAGMSALHSPGWGQEWGSALTIGGFPTHVTLHEGDDPDA